ncbi:PPE family protein [Mycobacterium canetti]|uniref:PPE family protein n=1 Tax=Mycobacterium canetti TaxID=78331 RepID=UPI0002A56DB6|nr:PPE family protein [Mycobacterium canetti]CCK61255.1 Conserved protein of unknown function, uncharacterized PPE family protein PPE51 [Mycobacterium canettii CIPT 140070010]
MDYAFLPPEINSARMYSGPGPNSMLVAAASWDALAAELASAAENYGSVIARLTGMHWWGPASTSMLAMSAPYVEWLERTAAQTKQTATQARAAAAAFEQAHAMTVPPALVTANRAELKALIASNLLGQNTAAIAAIEAQYAEMWAQDAAAMYGYATTSAAARQLTPFSSPQQTTNPAGLAAQNAAVTQAATNSAGNTPTALSQLSSFLSQAVQAPAGWPNILPDDFTILDGIFAAYATVGVTQDIESICAGIIGAENNLGLLGAASENPAELAPGAFGIGAALSSAEKGAAAGMHDAVLASAGRAGSIGPMSVPPSWATPSSTPVSALSGAGLTTLDGTDVAEHGTPGLPGVPAGTDKRASGVIPRYGIRLTVMSRPPAAG